MKLLITLLLVSANVFANGKAIGRIGDGYGGETISSGSGNVFAN